MDGVIDRHGAAVQSDGDGQPGHPDERLDTDTDGEAGMPVPEALVDAQFLGVVGPSLDE